MCKSTLIKLKTRFVQLFIHQISIEFKHVYAIMYARSTVSYCFFRWSACKYNENGSIDLYLSSIFFVFISRFIQLHRIYSGCSLWKWERERKREEKKRTRSLKHLNADKEVLPCVLPEITVRLHHLLSEMRVYSTKAYKCATYNRLKIHLHEIMLTLLNLID